MNRISRWITLGILPAFVLAGCGGSNPFVCDVDILYHGDSILKGTFDTYDLGVLPSPHDDGRYEPGLGTRHILGEQGSGLIEERMALFDRPPYEVGGPDMVIMNSGAWDIDPLHVQETVPIDEYRRNLHDALSWYQVRVDTVVFMLTLAGDGGNNRYDRMVEEYNAVAVEVCDAIGVDYFDPNGLPVDYADGIHPDRLGYEFIAQALNLWLGARYECVPF